MTQYLLIESNDPFEVRSVDDDLALAARLADDGHDVTLFLVQNGVLPARAGTRSDGLESIVQKGVEILADEFSLRERGIPGDGLAGGVRPAPLDVVVDGLAAGHKTIWL